jgi:hypothetical protein
LRRVGRIHKHEIRGQTAVSRQVVQGGRALVLGARVSRVRNSYSLGADGRRAISTANVRAVLKLRLSGDLDGSSHSSGTSCCPATYCKMHYFHQWWRGGRRFRKVAAPRALQRRSCPRARKSQRRDVGKRDVCAARIGNKVDRHRDQGRSGIRENKVTKSGNNRNSCVIEVD